MVVQRFAKFRDKDLNLNVAPAHNLLEQKQRKPFQALVQKGKTVRPNLLHGGIAAPCANGHGVVFFNNVDVARRLHQLAHLAVLADAQRLAHALRGLEEDVCPALVDVLWVVADLGHVAQHHDVVLKVLDPAARDGGAEGLLVERAPVADAAVEAADVDVVEGLGRIRPLELRVFDVEHAVWRHPHGLDGADVGADDLGGRVGVGHVDGPDAGAGADVEDSGGRLGERRLEQPVAEDHGDEVVRDVEAIVLPLVVGGPVLRRLGVLVCAPVDVAVVVYAVG